MATRTAWIHLCSTLRKIPNCPASTSTCKTGLSSAMLLTTDCIGCPVRELLFWLLAFPPVFPSRTMGLSHPTREDRHVIFWIFIFKKKSDHWCNWHGQGLRKPLGEIRQKWFKSNRINLSLTKNLYDVPEFRNPSHTKAQTEAYIWMYERNLQF